MKAFINGNVYVSFKPVKKIEAFVVANGRILKTGKTWEISRLAQVTGAEIVDLEGATVTPGFIDSHMHIEELGLALLSLELRGVKSIKELKGRVKEYAKNSKTTWIIGHGWDQEAFKEGRWPTRWDLDEVVPDRPVILSRVCMHAAVMNTKAMELTGLLTSDLPGIVREEGKPTGIVKEGAFEAARKALKENLNIEDYERFIITAQEHLMSLGVTSIGTMSVDEKTLKALSSLDWKGKLVIRTFAYVDPGKRGEGKNMFRDTSLLDAMRTLGLRTGFGGRRLKINGIKVLADGSLGARTAWLSKPYSDEPTRGKPNIEPENLIKIVKKADEEGLQMAVHGIGDAAIDMILKAYSSVQSTGVLRHRIEHASLLRPDQVERIAKLGVVVSVQPRFVVSDWWAPKRVGEKRMRWLYPFKSMIKAGIKLGFGTDAPIEPANPWETVYAAVTRGNIGYNEGEELTVEEALHAYTAGSAYVLHAEDYIGTLKEGKLADFIVLNEDPLDLTGEELRKVKVMETWIAGERVWVRGK